MKAFNLLTVAAKYVVRNRTRSLLTIVGVATGMFLFATIETMQNSLKDATVASANDTTMIVYRENRFCPSTSRLPEYYKEEIQKIEGVSSVVPYKGTVAKVIREIMSNVRSGMSYSGARSLQEFKEKAQLVLQTSASSVESSMGRRKGTSAPAFSDISAISSSSVLTITRSTHFA